MLSTRNPFIIQKMYYQRVNLERSSYKTGLRGEEWVEEESLERKAPKEEITHENIPGQEGSRTLETLRQGLHWGAGDKGKGSGRWGQAGGQSQSSGTSGC